jgi:tetratricopeptide (TPR) repeat protein
MQRILAFIIIVSLCSAHVFALAKAHEQQKSISQTEDLPYMLPSAALKISSLEFDGIVSDFLFLRALGFLGSLTEKRLLSGQQHAIATPQQWKWFYSVLEASTDLDPLFLDPYYIAQAYLTWDANMVQEANTLLEKGTFYRSCAWLMPFIAGFNHFFFLQDNYTAAQYLMESSRRPNASPIIASLAARLAYKAHNTENAIFFLEELLKKTEDPKIQTAFEKRLKTLRAIRTIEQAVALYEERFGAKPHNLQQLIDKNLLKSIPEDPYGGHFFLDKDETVKTTSNLNPVARSNE